MDGVSLTQVIDKLRRDMPRNEMVMRVCDELERLRKPDALFEARHGFDRRAYQREYMRKRRAKVDAGNAVKDSDGV